MKIDTDIVKEISQYFTIRNMDENERVNQYLPLREFLVFLKMRKLKPSLENVDLFMKSHTHRKFWKDILHDYIHFLK